MPLGRNMQKVSKRGETKTAREIGGRRQPGSGSGPHAKGDIKSKHLLIERKDTTQTGYRITFADLEKLRKQAAMADKIPAFLIADARSGDEFAVIKWPLFLDLFVLYCAAYQGEAEE